MAAPEEFARHVAAHVEIVSPSQVEARGRRFDTALRPLGHAYSGALHLHGSGRLAR